MCGLPVQSYQRCICVFTHPLCSTAIFIARLPLVFLSSTPVEICSEQYDYIHGSPHFRTSMHEWDIHDASPALSHSKVLRAGLLTHMFGCRVWSVRYNHSHDQLVLTASSDSRLILSNMVSISSEPFGHLVDDDELSEGEDNHQDEK